MEQHILRRLTAGLLIIFSVMHAPVAAQAPHLIAKGYYAGSGTGGHFFIADSTQYYYPSAGSALYNEYIDYQYANNTIRLNKYDFTYDVNGHLTQIVLQQSDTAAGSVYTDFRKTVYTLNGAGFSVNVLTQLYAGGIWGNYTNQIMIRNAANNVADQVNQNWDAASGSWINANHFTNTYNAQNNMTQQIQQYWDPVYNWVNQARDDYAYDASGMNVTQRTRMLFNSVAGSWLNRTQLDYSFNAAGKLVLYYSKLWNGTTSNWDTTGLNTFTYDAAGNQVLNMAETRSATTPFQNYYRLSQAFNSYNQILRDTLLFWISGAWTITTSSYANSYYYGSPTGIGATTGADVSLLVTPNPATEALRISLKWQEAQAVSGAITDMTGRIYITFSAHAGKEFGTTLPIRDLPAGNYLLTLKGSAGGSASRMVTVRK